MYNLIAFFKLSSTQNIYVQHALEHTSGPLYYLQTGNMNKWQ